jgi:hypothetical protein
MHCCEAKNKPSYTDNMKSDIFKKIGIGFCIMVALYIVVGCLLTETPNAENTTLIKGHFKYIQKIVAKGDASYDLYIHENQDYFKIKADWANCFSYESFKDEVQEGQPIELLIKRDNSWISFTKPSIIAVSVNGNDYLYQSCVVQNINHDKILIPSIFGGALLLYGFYLLYKKRTA